MNDVLDERERDKREIQGKRIGFSEAELEHVLGGTIERVENIDERLKAVEINAAMIPELRTMISAISAAQTAMAQSAKSMAETFKRMEDRAERQEVRYETLTQIATGRDQIPLKSHYWTVAILVCTIGAMALGAMAAVSYYTGTDIKASLKSIEFNQSKTQEKIREVVEKVQEVAGEVDDDAKERRDDGAPPK